MSVFKETFSQEELPYDKFRNYGPDSLTDAELLAIILRTGTKNKSPLDIGREVISLSDGKWGLMGLHHYSMSDLMQLNGIGEVKAIQLLCIAEIAKRISHSKAQRKLEFDNPDTVADYYMEELRHKEIEQFLLVLLDSKNRLLKDVILSSGTVNATIVSPREIFIQAVKENATNIMMLHNHPSGDPNPSKQDKLITGKIKEVSELIDIPLIDHIIIGDNQFFSFKQNGLL